MDPALSGSLYFWGFFCCACVWAIVLNNIPLVLMDMEVPIQWRAGELLLCKALLAFHPGDDGPEPLDSEWYLVSGNLTSINRELCRFLSIQNVEYLFAIDTSSVRLL